MKCGFLRYAEEGRISLSHAGCDAGGLLHMRIHFRGNVAAD